MWAQAPAVVNVEVAVVLNRSFEISDSREKDPVLRTGQTFVLPHRRKFEWFTGRLLRVPCRHWTTTYQLQYLAARVVQLAGVSGGESPW